MKMREGLEWFARVASALALVLSFAGGAAALEPSDIATQLTAYKVSATDVNTGTTLGGGVMGVAIYNAGANEIFVQFNAAATTSSAEIPAGTSIGLGYFAAQAVGIICSSGETSTVYVYTLSR